MEENVIEIRDLCYQYDPEKKSRNVVDHLNLSIKKGSFTAIIGPNGSGKSTLSKLINGLYLPVSGSVLVKGMDTRNEETLLEIRKTAGLVMQNPDNQIVSTVVEEDCAFGPENLGLSPLQIRKRVNDALRAVDMLDFADRAPHMLSGGQKQRIAIAGILAMKPEIMIFDEPTAMLDPVGRGEVLSCIRRLNREEGITVILITHYMEETTEADRVVMLSGGRITFDATPREVFSQAEAVKQAGLDVPAMTELAFLLRSRGADIPEDILTIDEMEDALCR